MRVIPTALPEVLVIEPVVYGDERGFFTESWNRRTFSAAVGADVEFVQDNLSRSAHRVLRGLHFQLPPHAQGKLIRVVRGSIFDVAVDVRRASDTFGEWAGAELSEENGHQLWIPSGFAHGFLVLSEGADVVYKASDYYAPDLDRSVRWNDPSIGIDWPLAGAEPILSPKDAAAPLLEDADVFV